MHADNILKDNADSICRGNALGRGDSSSDCDGGDFDEGHERGEELVVACGDALELFELAEVSLDGVVFFVERLVVGLLVLAMTSWRDHRFGAGIQDDVHQPIGVIGPIRQHRAGLDAIDEVEALDHVVFLAGPGQEVAGVA